MSNALTTNVPISTFFNNDAPPDRFSPEYLQAQRARQEATLASMIAARRRPVDVLAPFSNSGIADQEGGTAPLGGYTDQDIADRANAMARDVSRADVVPFRKHEEPRNPRPPTQQPLRPAASVCKLDASEWRKVAARSPKEFATLLSHNIAVRMGTK